MHLWHYILCLPKWRYTLYSVWYCLLYYYWLHTIGLCRLIEIKISNTNRSFTATYYKATNHFICILFIPRSCISFKIADTIIMGEMSTLGFGDAECSTYLRCTFSMMEIVASEITISIPANLAHHPLHTDERTLLTLKYPLRPGKQAIPSSCYINLKNEINN